MTIHTSPGTTAVDDHREPMLLGHYLTYQTVRSNLCALAEATGPDHLHDYWDVLDLIDSLHEPAQLAVALPVHNISRYAMYDAVSNAIRYLSRYGLDPVVLHQARDLLDATWAADPGTAR